MPRASAVLRAARRAVEQRERGAQVDGRARAVDGQLGGPELEQHVHDLRPGRRLVERAPQVVRRHVGRTARQRLPRGGAQALDRARVVPRRAGEDVRGDLLGGAAGLEQQLGGARVGAPLLVDPEARVDGGALDRVDELDDFARPQDPRAPERRRRRERGALVELREPPGIDDARTVAQHRRRRRERARLGGQLPDARTDRADDRLGPDLEDGAGVAGHRLDRPRLQRAGQLDHQQRVPAGRSMAGRAHLRVGAGELPADERGGRVLAQRPRPERPRRGVVRQRVQEGGGVELASSGRSPAATTTGRPSSRRARKLRNRTDGWSHQWRSSTPRNSGRLAAMLAVSQ